MNGEGKFRGYLYALVLPLWFVLVGVGLLIFLVK